MKLNPLIFLVIVLSISSCVSKKKYNELGQYYENIEQDLKKSREEVRDLKQELGLIQTLIGSDLILPETSMSFKSPIKDFGKILSTTTNEHSFVFTNTGTEPLVISNAKGSCGCTIPQFPKEPILPGETGEIKVVYKPKGQSGLQIKTVTITANTSPKSIILKIKGDIQEK
ncbi:MAG: DUF1573 domain-containing protein [Flavobacteriales bacterium]